MLHVPVRKNTDAQSTVTDLISDFDARRASWPVRHAPTSKNDTKECNSSTKLLRNYIRQYDRSQTKNLAEALTYQTHLDVGFSENGEINKEISYARDLLGPSQTSLQEDVRSLTTDDLLTMGPSSNALSGFGHTSLDITPSLIGNENCPSVRPVPKGHAKILTSSKKPESSGSMRFSEIASRNFYSRTLSETSSTDSNLFTLNGVNYTPHSIKYKSLYGDSNGERMLVSPRREMPFRGALLDSSFNDSSSDTTVSPERFTAHAGRTPYKSRNSRYLPSSESSDRTLENADDLAVIPTPHSEFSSSHYSVPINLKGETPAMREFMETCLEEDDCGISKPSGTSGSVETLKNMLFTLQSINSVDSVTSVPQDDIDGEGGPASLKKAFSHLANLKDLLA